MLAASVGRRSPAFSAADTLSALMIIAGGQARVDPHRSEADQRNERASGSVLVVRVWQALIRSGLGMPPLGG
jgi:hypothetical protein